MASSTLSLDTDPMGVEEGQDFLQKHVAFFDRNKDGIVYPWETFQGFRAIGAGVLLSTFASFFINMGLSSKTLQGKRAFPLFPIEVKNIPKAKHGSDSGVYDSEGRFVPSKFEEIFKKHAHTHPHALTSDELSAMLRANREPKDYAGWIAALSEWKILYFLCKDKNGLLQKATIRAVYDGSLFERLEKERQSAKKKASLSLRLLFVNGFLCSVIGYQRNQPEGVEEGQDFLQKHVAFFDRNKDGIIYPGETFQGFRAIGAGVPLSLFASISINMALSSKTRPGESPSPLFPIVVKNIPKAKHGSDTGAYDSEGRFVPSNFEEIFNKHAHTHPDALTSDELSEMLKANREPNDKAGWLAAASEWKILYTLCKDKNGLLQKETIRAVYDGSLFERMEKEKHC